MTEQGLFVDFWNETRDMGPTVHAKMCVRKCDLLGARINKKTLVKNPKYASKTHQSERTLTN